jgi:hypothetical protein
MLNSRMLTLNMLHQVGERSTGSTLPDQAAATTVVIEKHFFVLVAARPDVEA